MKKQIYTLFALMMALSLYAQDQPAAPPMLEIEQASKTINHKAPAPDTRTTTATGCSDHFYMQGIDAEQGEFVFTDVLYAPGIYQYFTTLDDFVLDSESNIGTVIITLNYNGSDCTQFSYSIDIRENNNGYPGSVISTSYIAPGEAILTKEGLSTYAAGISYYYNAHLPIDPIVLSAGNYFLEVQIYSDITNTYDYEKKIYLGLLKPDSEDAIGTPAYLTWYGGSPYQFYFNGASTPYPHYDLMFALCGPGSTPVQACFAPPPLEAICKDATVTLNQYGNAYVWTGTINDGSVSVSSMNVSQNYFYCSDLGYNDVTLTVYDNQGNSDQCTASVLVQDIAKPDASCRYKGIQLGAGGTYTLQESDVFSATSSSDNCGIQTVDFTPMTFDCSDMGQWFYPTVTVYDASGNFDNCTASIYVNTGGCIEALCQNITVALQSGGQLTISANDIDDGSTGATNMSVSPSTFTCTDLGNNTVTLTVTDGNNSDACTAIVSVQDGVGLPGAWTGTDIGATNPSGNDYNFTACNTTSTNDEFTVSGAGNNATSLMTDNVAFASQSLCGDGSITAKIESVDASGYGGLMIRENAAAGSKMVAVYSNMSSQLRYESRSMTNAPKSVQSFFKPSPIWLRITRQGMWIHTEYSSNGMSFQPVQSTMLSMTSCVEIGLASFTYLAMGQTEATFSNVTTTGNIQGGSSSLAVAPPTSGPHNSVKTPAHKIALFPNPTQEHFTLSLDRALEQDTRVDVINLYGQLIATKMLEAGTIRQDWQTTDWAAGTYLLRIQQKAKAPLVKSFVVMK